MSMSQQHGLRIVGGTETDRPPRCEQCPHAHDLQSIQRLLTYLDAIAEAAHEATTGG